MTLFLTELGWYKRDFDKYEKLNGAKEAETRKKLMKDIIKSRISDGDKLSSTKMI